MTLPRLAAEESAIVDVTELVAQCMADLGLSPVELAAAAGMSRRRVARLLQGLDVQVADVAGVLHVMGYELRVDRVRTSRNLIPE